MLDGLLNDLIRIFSLPVTGHALISPFGKTILVHNLNQWCNMNCEQLNLALYPINIVNNEERLTLPEYWNHILDAIQP
jgi:hypothetical protein